MMAMTTRSSSNVKARPRLCCEELKHRKTEMLNEPKGEPRVTEEILNQKLESRKGGNRSSDPVKLRSAFMKPSCRLPSRLAKARSLH